MYLHWLISFPNGRHGSVAARRGGACGWCVGWWGGGGGGGSTEPGADPEERLEGDAPIDQVDSG